MRELSLHIMDLVENSLRAQATIVAVTVEARAAEDRLRIVIEDNGTGLTVPPEAALNPFYTTKRGKRTGLGLSLFRAAAEATGGHLALEPSSLAGETGTAGPGGPGLRVSVELGLSHVDRNPLGDLAGTLASIVCTSPQTDFRFRIQLWTAGVAVCVAELARERGLDRADGLALARAVQEALDPISGLTDVRTEPGVVTRKQAHE